MSVGAGPAGDQAVVREVIARLDSTLAASGVRVELRSGFDDLIPSSRLLPPEDHDPGRVERLVTGAARPASEVSPTTDEVTMTLALASDRFGWSLLPVAYRVRPPRD